MSTSNFVDRIIPVISLHNFELRKAEIQAELTTAAENSGFFTLVDHGFTVDEIEAQFEKSKQFFSLPMSTKGKTPHDFATNMGWEFRSQVRPSTGNADMKESLWLQIRAKDKVWPSNQDVPNFRENTAAFMEKCHRISMQILSLFALALGFEEDHFAKAHQFNSPESLTTLRLLHYMPEKAVDGHWRAGSHTDLGCLTLLFQREGEDGLEVCPGRESHTDYATGDVWTKVPAHTGPIVCNIGDMLMSWSDDRFKSNFHRVAPGVQSSRYSIAYFNQGMEDCVIQGPLKKYPARTGAEYLAEAMQRNFKALEVIKRK